MTRPLPSAMSPGRAPWRPFRAPALLAVAALLTLAGCENMKTSSRRVLLDLRMIAVAPVNISANLGKEMGQELVSPPWVLNQAKALTWTPVFGLARHGCYTLLHTADAAVYPLYLPFGAEPWTVYDTDTFPFPIDAERESQFWDSVGDTLSVSIVAVGKFFAMFGYALLKIFTLGVA